MNDEPRKLRGRNIQNGRKTATTPSKRKKPARKASRIHYSS